MPPDLAVASGPPGPEPVSRAVQRRPPRLQAGRLVETLRHRPVLTLCYGFVALVALLAVVGPLIVPHNPTKQSTELLMAPGSRGHLLGTDYLGRDQLSRLISGARPVLLVSLSAVLVSAVIGMAIGLVAGYRRGWLEVVLLRTMDAILSFPLMLLGIIMVAALGSGPYNLVFVIAIALVPIFARLVYALALQEGSLDYALAARAVGMSPTRIMVSELTPNLLGPVLVQATSLFSVAVGFSTALSYLGLGIQAPSPDWGLMVKDGQPYLSNAADLAVIPGLCITVLLVAVTFVGDDLRDRLDPQGRVRLGRTG